jgi:aspartate-semialdehyde dehydrogenase
MFDVPDEISAQWARSSPARGAVGGGQSGAFRMDPDVPLVVRRSTRTTWAAVPKGIVSNPNCTTLSMIVAVGALHRAFGLEEMVVASYQAASGAGQAGIDTLYAQLDKVSGTRSLGQRAGDVRSAVGDLGPFPAPLAMNVVPWAGSLKADGWSSEELKIRNESRKILGLPGLKVAATCVRVPVVTTHSVAVHATFSRPVSREQAWEVLRIGAGRGGGRRPGSRRVPDPGRRGRHGPVLGGPGAPVARRPQDDRAVRLRRQPAQGRGAEHGSDRRAGGGRAWVASVTVTGRARPVASGRREIAGLPAGIRLRAPSRRICLPAGT